MCLSCYCLCQKCFTGSRRSYKQSSFRQLRSDGGIFAGIMQESLRSHLDTENKREAKANESYYLLKKTAYPTIIVECGFLSNSEEAAKLSTGEYQEAVAEAIADGILDCLGNETVDTEEAGMSNETADTEKQKTKQH